MIDGRLYRTLKHYLATSGLTPDEYRARYDPESDYLMLAPAYSESRRETAMRLGLGRKPAEAPAVASKPVPVPAEPVSQAEQPAPIRKPGARKSAAEAKEAATKHLGG
jgi:hypothetical protein